MESIPGLLKSLKIRALDSLLGFTDTATGTEKNVPEKLNLHVQRVVEFMNGPSCISTHTLTQYERITCCTLMHGGGGEGGMATLTAEE